MTEAQRAIAMMIHRAYRHGSDPVFHADLMTLAEYHEDLRPVFEELQYLRSQHEQLLEEVDLLRSENDR